MTWDLFQSVNAKFLIRADQNGSKYCVILSVIIDETRGKAYPFRGEAGATAARPR